MAIDLFLYDICRDAAIKLDRNKMVRFDQTYVTILNGVNGLHPQLFSATANDTWHKIGISEVGKNFVYGDVGHNTILGIIKHLS